MKIFLLSFVTLLLLIASLANAANDCVNRKTSNQFCEGESGAMGNFYSDGWCFNCAGIGYYALICVKKGQDQCHIRTRRNGKQRYFWNDLNNKPCYGIVAHWNTYNQALADIRHLQSSGYRCTEPISENQNAWIGSQSGYEIWNF